MKKIFWSFALVAGVLLASLNTFASSVVAESVCQTSGYGTYPDAYKECEQLTESTTYFDNQGVNACKSNLIASTPMDRNACLTTIADARFLPAAAQICTQVMQYDYSQRGFACLQNIANKSYSNSEISRCQFHGGGMTDDSTLAAVDDCLAGAGQYETDSNGQVIIVIIINNNTVVNNTTVINK
jgi:hypothetical protein